MRVSIEVIEAMVDGITLPYSSTELRANLLAGQPPPPRLASRVDNGIGASLLLKHEPAKPKPNPVSIR